MNTRMNSVRFGIVSVAAFATLATLLLLAWAQPALAGKPGGYTMVALDARPGYARSIVHDIKVINGTIMCVGLLDEAEGNKAVFWEVATSGSSYDVTTHYLAGGDYAIAMNTSGEAVGACNTFDPLKQLSLIKGLCWTDSGQSPLELAPLNGDTATEPRGINAEGVIVGRSICKYATYDEDGNVDQVFEESRAAAWRIDDVNENGELVPVDLSNGSGLFSAAHDINDCDDCDDAKLAQVVGHDEAAAGAVTWVIDCASDPMDSTEPVLLVYHATWHACINELGDVGGRRYSLPFRRLADGTFEELSVPRRATGEARDINDQRQVVGQVMQWNPSGGFSGSFGAMWQADGKLVDLDKLLGRSDWRHIHRGNAITSGGIIAAAGLLNADGESRALLMIPN